MESKTKKYLWVNIICLFCLFILQPVFIPIKAQTPKHVTVRLEEGSLSDILRQIQSQSGFYFFYDDALGSIRMTQINIDNLPVEKAMDILFRKLGISYNVDDNIVYLKLNRHKENIVKNLRGQVCDTNGEPLAGVHIDIAGYSGGCETDPNGYFVLLNIAEDAQATFSYLGFKARNMMIGRKNGFIHVVLKEDPLLLADVVVTALDIKREKKMLGYAVQDIKTNDLNRTGEPSVAHALQGKVAGLHMSASNTGLGGSAKITIRGNSSLTDNNQPLWIVDGVPFNDTNISDASFYGGIDRGGTSLDINTEDIEAISVLKGPNAAALYGSRAGNGVILVTTRKAKRQTGLGVDYSTHLTWSDIAETLETQDRYGQGSDGQFSPTSASSWGAVLDGSLRKAWNGEEYSYEKYGNKMMDFFRKAFTQSHYLALGNVTEKAHFRSAFGYTKREGFIPGEQLERINANVNSGMEFNRYLSMDVKIALSRTKANNRPYYGGYGILAQLMNIPHNVRLKDLQAYSTSDRVHVNWTGPNSTFRNPYYVLNQFQNEDERWRAFGYYQLKLSLADWMQLRGKYAFDIYRTRLDELNRGAGIAAESKPSDIKNDNFMRGEENFFEHNIELLLTGERAFGGSFLDMSYTFGANFMYQDFETFMSRVTNMVDKNNIIFNGANQLSNAANHIKRRATNSVFGAVQLAYRDFAFLDLTARNDWSSTLPVKNNSFFYPSTNVSFVLTDFCKTYQKPLPDWLTFAKARLSAAQVGKDTDPYQLYNTYSYAYENGVLIPDKSNIKKNPDLKPEISTSYEVGLDMRFLKNRLGFDFTYYYSNTKNQIMKIPAPAPWSGGQIVNAGLIRNRGFELQVYGTPVQVKDFVFGLNFNLSANSSLVKELAEGLDYMFFDGDPHFPIHVGTRIGRPLGEIYAKTLFKRDERGNLLINDKGRPIKVASETAMDYMLDNPIGNIEPKCLMSLSPRFEYKNITLTALFDMRVGGEIVSMSEAMATAVGLSMRTLNRGEKENGMITIPGFHFDGTPNTTPINAQKYYQSIGGSSNAMAEEFVYSASYIKLRELSLAYRFPQRWIKSLYLNNLSVAFVARNLGYLLKHTPGTSPEGGYDVSMFSQAIDYTTIPYSRTFGISVQVGF
ncbi:MAG: SusC/RagA family TonB-linked outer membrane protein [Bacteroidales bacterium]